MPYPETYMPIWVRAWNDDDLAPLVDTLRRLSLDDTIRMVPQIVQHADLRLVHDRSLAVVGRRRADPRRA